MAHVTCTESREHLHKYPEDPDIITSAAADDSSVARDGAVHVLVKKLIQRKLEKVPSLASNCSIYRVPKPMFKRKPEAYIPRLVSIGPFHRTKKHLKPMEASKLLYMNDFQSRRECQATWDDYVNAMIELEVTARQCYSETIQQSKEEFVEMMLIDGCFILEFLYRFKHGAPAPIHNNDPIMNAIWMCEVLMCDLILLENQLPFFVLERLYSLFTGDSNSNSNSNSNGLHTLISGLFLNCVPTKVPRSITPESSPFRCSSELAKKVFGFISVITRRLTAAKKDEEEEGESLLIKHEEYYSSLEAKVKAKQFLHLLDFVRDMILQSFSGQWKLEKKRGGYMSIYCATQLKEGSVKFEKEEQQKNKCLMDITFQNGVLKIPTIIIQDMTESLLRNLIAFEQSSDDYDNYITDCAAFMNHLINSPTDVELLAEKGIIMNFLGEPKEVAVLFNGLLKEVTRSGGDYFSSVRQDLKKYYETSWHRWKASLMRDYFKSPWASISVIAASILLLLTVAQTICSILALT